MFDFPTSKSSKLTLPLISWDVYALGALHFHPKTFKEDLQALRRFSKHYKWKINLDSILQNPYQALVLTNIDQKILWANEGFETLTGHTSSEVIGKNPSFLQGSNTDKEVKNRIRKNLHSPHEFSETIVNYRRDGSEYLCTLQIFPLIDQDLTITHFLALESEG